MGGDRLRCGLGHHAARLREGTRPKGASAPGSTGRSPRACRRRAGSPPPGRGAGRGAHPRFADRPWSLLGESWTRLTERRTTAEHRGACEGGGVEAKAARSRPAAPLPARPRVDASPGGRPMPRACETSKLRAAALGRRSRYGAVLLVAALRWLRCHSRPFGNRVLRKATVGSASRATNLARCCSAVRLRIDDHERRRGRCRMSRISLAACRNRSSEP